MNLLHMYVQQSEDEAREESQIGITKPNERVIPGPCVVAGANICSHIYHLNQNTPGVRVEWPSTK